MARPVRRAGVALLAAGMAAVGMYSVAAAAPATESVYFNGQTYEINVAGAVKIANDSPLVQQAIPLFIIGFPVAPGTTGPITLPSGYQPQANGIPVPIPYHDHLLSCIPGGSNDGCQYAAPLRVVNLMYSWVYAYSLDFEPITRAEDIPAAELAGKLQVINPGAADPFEVWTNDVLIRPVVGGAD